MQNDLNNLFENINIAVDFIRKAGYAKSPVAGLTFGSGLGGMSERMEIELEIPYDDIPGFVPATVDFHKGSLIFCGENTLEKEIENTKMLSLLIKILKIKFKTLFKKK